MTLFHQKRNFAYKEPGPPKVKVMKKKSSCEEDRWKLKNGIKSPLITYLAEAQL